MVSGADKHHIRFIGKMILRFRGFTGQMRINTFACGRLRKSLRIAATPGSVFNFAFKIADNSRLMVKYHLDTFRQLRQCLRGFQTTCIQQVLFVGLSFEHPIEFLGQLRVTA